MEEYVMISYNQASAGHLARKINNKLKENNLKTWIDYEKMGGDINNAMAEAIDGAFVVLVLITNEYCASRNCKKECSYADQHGKPIIPIRVNASCDPIRLTGNVGIIISGLLYQDFSDPSTFNISFNNLLVRIKQYQAGTSNQKEIVGLSQYNSIPAQRQSFKSRILKFVGRKESIKTNQTGNQQPKEISKIIRYVKEEKYSKVKKLIEEQNANVNYKDSKRRTPLAEASKHGRTQIVKLLIENGANVNEKSKGGATALIKASQNGHKDTIKVLLENGALINLEDDEGKSAYARARNNWHFLCANYLKSKGAK